MKSAEAWFISQRADSLATMFLTRVPSLRIERLSDDMGIDYLVRLDQRSSHFFGVQVKASKAMRNLVKESSLTTKIADQLLKSAKEAAFPVAVLAIDITTEEMKFGWININPRIKTRGSLSTVTMHPATTEELKKSLQDVKDWYARKRGGVALENPA